MYYGDTCTNISQAYSMLVVAVTKAYVHRIMLQYCALRCIACVASSYTTVGSKIILNRSLMQACSGRAIAFWLQIVSITRFIVCNAIHK